MHVKAPSPHAARLFVDCLLDSQVAGENARGKRAGMPAEQGAGGCAAHLEPRAGDAHDRLGDTERDHLGVYDPAPGVGSCLWQKIVGCAINDGAESVEVGVHRGLRVDGDLDTVGFGLSALLSSHRLNLVESII